MFSARTVGIVDETGPTEQDVAQRQEGGGSVHENALQHGRAPAATLAVLELETGTKLEPLCEAQRLRRLAVHRPQHRLRIVVRRVCAQALNLASPCASLGVNFAHQ